MIIAHTANEDLVTDRTLQDVDRWRVLRDKGWVTMTEAERIEWMGETTPIPAAWKGMYTYKDMNRVESAVVALSARLVELGYKHPTLSVKTNWEANNHVWYADMVRYLGNIGVLRNSIPVYLTTPPAPKVGEAMTYVVANDIEKILRDIETIVEAVPKSWNYSGEIMAGEV